MAKVILIWGSPSSGKSMFSCMLAMELSAENKKTMIFSADQNVPMLPVLLPGQSFNNSTSISALFQAEQVNPAIVAHTVHILKQNPMIGVLGYSNDEIPIHTLWPGTSKIKEILEIAGTMVDYIIWDCTSDMNCCMNTAMMELSDLVVRIITPDLKGIHYYGLCEKRLKSERYHFSNQLTLAGMVRAYHTVDELSYLTGGIKGILPFSKEMDRGAAEGGFFYASGHCHTKYRETVEDITEQILNLKHVLQEG